MKELRQVAGDKGVELRLSRQGKHEVWLFGAELLVIPRHNEIDEYTAMAIERARIDRQAIAARGGHFRSCSLRSRAARATAPPRMGRVARLSAGPHNPAGSRVFQKERSMTAVPPRSDKFRVVARQGDEWWGIRVRELDWVFSQARRLEDVAETARDAIAAYYNVPASEVGEVVVDKVIPADILPTHGTPAGGAE
ncbi:MAG: hypothetical protein F4046_03900 [Acidimicrobiaceae bacterium]|nr:hypothetical protein [Acidimicrobiaceae bacterium]